MRHIPSSFAALLLVLATSAAQAEIRWETNLRAAKEKAEQEGKLLLLHFYSDNCVWCDRLEAGAFEAPEVADAIHRNYVPVKIHAGQNPGFAKTFRVTSFPTDVVVTPDGTALAHGTSPQAADRYVAMLAQHVPTQSSAANAVAANPVAAAPAVQVAAAPQAAAPQPGGFTMPEMQVAQPGAAANAAEVAGAADPLFAAGAAGTPAMAVSHRSQPNSTASALAKSPPQKLALDGYCAVSLLEKNEWTEGNPEFGVIHLGNLYLFVDEAAMAKFLSNPEPFTPVLNGIDVVRFFEEKRIVQGKREHGVRDPEYNRMFFFADQEAMVHFENQHNRYTESAIMVTRQAVADANPRR